MNLSAGGAQQIRLDQASWIEHIPGWLPAADAAALLASLITSAPREQRDRWIEILRLAASASLWPDLGLQAWAVADLKERYRVDVCDLGAVPQWVVANVMRQGAPPDDAAIDLDALLGSLGLRSPHSP
jgi:hypothetical protein